MPITIQVSDQSLTGELLGSLPLSLVSTRITLRELIRRRVYEEVREFQASDRRMLVEPTAVERALNGDRPIAYHKIDWETQADLAVKAFQKQTFFVTVGDRQVNDLDEELTLDLESEVAFVKLTPMVGG
jgi:hypothetical protein